MTVRRAVALAVIAGVFAVGVVAAGPAGAIDLPNPFSDKCPPGVPASKIPPTPSTPASSGIMGGLVSHDPNVTGDPFAPDAQVSIVDQYGYSGLEWHTYDLGCGGDLADPLAALHTHVGNIVMIIPITALQLLGFVGETFGNAEWLGIFDGVLESVAFAVWRGPVLVLFPITTFLLGLILVRRARQQSTADALTDVAWWLGLAVGIIVMLLAPTFVARQMDGLFDLGLDAVRDSFGAEAGPLANIGPAHEDTVYAAWLIGNFGDVESPAANQYGTDLFRAQAFSWQELRDIHSPDEWNDAVKRKQDTWKEIAEHIKQDYPQTYPNLQGKAGGTRWMAASGAALDVFALGWFLLWAGVAFVIARFSIRTFLVLWPAAAILGVLPKQRHRVITLWGTLTAALIRAAVAVFAAGVVSMLIGAVRSSPHTTQVTRMLASALISWAAWRALAPFRRMGMLETGAARMAKTVALTALGTKLGIQAAAGDSTPWPLRADEPTPQRVPPSGYDVGEAHPRNAPSGTSGGSPSGVTPVPSGMPAIDAVPTTVDGETVYRAQPRAETRHRKVNQDAA